MRVSVVANLNACKRTKNLIREKGPNFFVWKRNGTMPHPDNRPAILLIEDKSESRNAWAGWLPLDEIEIEEIPT